MILSNILQLHVLQLDVQLISAQVERLCEHLLIYPELWPLTSNPAPAPALGWVTDDSSATVTSGEYVNVAPSTWCSHWACAHCVISRSRLLKVKIIDELNIKRYSKILRVVSFWNCKNKRYKMTTPLERWAVKSNNKLIAACKWMLLEFVFIIFIVLKILTNQKRFHRTPF